MSGGAVWKLQGQTPGAAGVIITNTESSTDAGGHMPDSFQGSDSALILLLWKLIFKRVSFDIYTLAELPPRCWPGHSTTNRLRVR
jgi:hypothetical protein